MTPEEAHENSVQWSAWRTTKLNLQTFLWSKCKRLCFCLEGDREERLLQKSFQHVLKEVSIARIVKQLRVLNAAVKQNMNELNWQELRDGYSLMAYKELESVLEQRN